MQGFSARRSRPSLVSALFLCCLLSLPTLAHAVVRRAPAPAPAPVAGVAAPTGLKVTSGNMVNQLTWSAARSTGLAGFRVERAPSATGPWSAVALKTSATSLSDRVKIPGRAFYRVSALDRRGRASRPTAAVGNDRLAMSSIVTSSGATLRASNGAVILTLLPGTFTKATRVGVADAVAPTSASVVRVTGAFDFTATSALLKPARVTIPYRIPVKHFQVAGTLARGIDWMSWDSAKKAWVPVTTSVDTTASTLTAEMPHFSYWIGAFIQPHGTTVSKTTYCATLCHRLEAAPGSPIVLANTDSQVCYNCHGNVSAGDPAAGSAGHNIQAEFYACSGQGGLPAGGSMHPVRAPGSTTGLTCTACHDPHLDPTASPKLLRAYDAITNKKIASAGGTVPAAATYCAACHSSIRKNSAADALVPGYWARSGGGRVDFSRYAGSVHDSEMASSGTVYSCSGCHKPHASGDNPLLLGAGMIDTTSDRTTAQGIAKAACFGCHSGSGSQTWNGRDVKAEFARASHHPVVAETADAAPLELSTFGVMEQDRTAEFELGLGVGTAVEVGDTVRLADDSWMEAYPLKRLMFGMPTTGNATQQFDPVTGLWGSMGFTPPNRTGSTTSGDGAFAAEGKVYAFSDYSNGSAPLDVYTPASGTGSGTWASKAGYQIYTNYGSDIAVDAGHRYAYLLNAGPSTSAAVHRLDLRDDTWLDSAFTLPHVVGGGTAAAYSPSTDQFFYINRWCNNWSASGDGRLYGVSSPSTASGAVTSRDTGVTLAAGPEGPNGLTRMECVTIGGADYLLVIGGYAGSPGLRVVSDLGSASPVYRDTGKAPFATGYSGLAWDGGEYLYANSYCTFVRIKIPADPANGTWGDWEPVASPPINPYFGTAMAFIDAQAPDRLVSGYQSAGTFSTDIDAPAGAVHWGTIEWSAVTPAGTSVTTRVRGWNGTAWVDLPGYTSLGTSPADLSGISAVTYRRIRVSAVLATTNKLVTPRLTGWRVTAAQGQLVHRDPAGGTVGIGAITCASCHNVHNVRGGTGVWDLARTSDPQNTRLPSTDVTSTISGFCLRCHTTQVIRGGSTATRTVAYDVLFGWTGGAPYFTGFDKDSPGLSPYASAHFTTTGTRAYCETCHDPHGSNNANLVAWTRPASFPTGVPGVRDNTSTASFEENLCLQCHGNGTVGKQASGAPDVATPLAGTYRHTTRDVSGKHSDQESASALGATNRHSECVDCHDPHVARPGTHTDGSAIAGGALYGAVGARPVYAGGNWTAPTGLEPIRLKGGLRDAEAYICFKCHSSLTTLPASGPSGGTYTDLALEFNPANQSYHNVLGLKQGVRESFTVRGVAYSWSFKNDLKAPYTKDSGLTCSECHTTEAVGQAKGPHGSASKFMMATGYSADFRNAYFADRQPTQVTPSNLICTKCHDFTKVNGVHDALNTGALPAHTGGLPDGGNGLCINCHIPIPHGWKRPRLLGYQSDPAPYATRAGYGTVSIVVGDHNTWNKMDCYASGCSSTFYGGRHNTVWSGDQIWP
jgi:hypothetical protein